MFQNASFQAKINNQQLLSPCAIFELKMHQNAFCDLREITALHRPPRWLSGAGREIKRRGGEGEGQREVFPTSIYNLITVVI